MTDTFDNPMGLDGFEFVENAGLHAHDWISACNRREGSAQEVGIDRASPEQEYADPLGDMKREVATVVERQSILLDLNQTDRMS